VNVLEVSIDWVVLKRGTSAARDEQLFDDLGRHADSTGGKTSRSSTAVASAATTLFVNDSLALPPVAWDTLFFIKSVYESSAPRAAPTAGVETERTWIWPNGYL